MDNLIALTDSYKLSHWYQYPPEMTHMQSYFESRGGEYKDIVFFGLRYYIEKYLAKPITENDVHEAAKVAKINGMPFNLDGWLEIAKLGFLPVRIVAKPEGSVCRPNEPLLTIENTDPRFPWLVNYLETLLMKLWYPCTVASKSYAVANIIGKVCLAHGFTMVDRLYMYHNFGDRGSTSVEAAAIGGMAHLTSFEGTDNLVAIEYLAKYYDSRETGVSIPATEHSTVTSWGKEREYDMITAFLEAHKSSQYGAIACVLDSYNIYNAVNFVTTELKSKIESKDYPIFVIRPDSGNPLEVIPSILSIMEGNNVKYTTETVGKKEYKLFDKYRIIWGDGVTPAAIEQILTLMLSMGYHYKNFAFGSGGDLMQNVNRDTCKFATKACAVQYKGNLEWLPVYKQPFHDSFKASKGGYQKVEGGVTYYDCGQTSFKQSFEQIVNIVEGH